MGKHEYEYNRGRGLSLEFYQKIANKYGVSVGKAIWNGRNWDGISSVSDLTDDLKVVILRQWIIGKGIYQQVQRELLRLEQKYKQRRIKEITLYHKALDIIVEREGITIDED